MSLIPIMPGAEPYFHRGGPVGCLVQHGFTASPAEVRWLAEHLAAQGHTVYAPRLAGHGTQPADLRRTHWRDWYATALDSVHLLRSQCERVVAIGHSMGGLLALLLAAEGQVNSVAALAAPVRFTRRRMRLSPWIKYVRPYTDQPDRTGFPDQLRAEQARRGEPVLGRVRYDQWPTASVAQLYRLSQVTYQRLPDITVPVLLVYSEGDHTVRPFQADLVAGRVSSAVIERHRLEICDHILPQDCERDQVFDWVAGFVARQSSSSQLP